MPGTLLAFQDPPAPLLSRRRKSRNEKKYEEREIDIFSKKGNNCFLIADQSIGLFANQSLSRHFREKRNDK